MRIAMILPELALRGSIRRSLTLSAGLVERGHDVLVACARGPLWDEPVLKGFEVLEWHPRMLRGLGGALARRAFVARVQEWAPDVVHVGTLRWATPWQPLVSAIDVPFVATVHAPSDAAHLPSLALARFSSFIAVNESVREALMNKARLARQRVRLIWPGASGKTSGPPTRSARRGDALIGAVGPIENETGYIVLLEACELLHQAGLGLRLMLLGSGSALPAVLRWIREHAAAGWAIHVDELFDHTALHAQLDALVCPDDSHDNIQFALEALAGGVPAVLAGRGGNYELLTGLTNAQRDALLYAPEDAVELAGTINNLLTDEALRGTIAESGRLLVRDRLSVERLVESTLSLYRDVAHIGDGQREGPWESRHGLAANG